MSSRNYLQASPYPVRLPVAMAGLFACLVASLVADPAAATMQLERNVVHLLPGQPPRVDLRVTNPDEETLYVEVEVLEVANPGTPEETRTPVRDPQAANFLVTPNKFIVAPGSRQLVRFVNTGGHGDAERIFRVNLKPVSPPMEATEHAIRLVVGYQVLVVIAPGKPDPDVAVSRIGNRLTVENRGNSNVLFRHGLQCASEEYLKSRNEDGCQGIKARRVYPGNIWQADLPYDTPVEFTLSDGGVARRERF